MEVTLFFFLLGAAAGAVVEARYGKRTLGAAESLKSHIEAAVKAEVAKIKAKI